MNEYREQNFNAMYGYVKHVSKFSLKWLLCEEKIEIAQKHNAWSSIVIGVITSLLRWTVCSGETPTIHSYGNINVQKAENLGMLSACTCP